jgi:hypothetical protein
MKTVTPATVLNKLSLLPTTSQDPKAQKILDKLNRDITREVARQLRQPTTTR